MADKSAIEWTDATWTPIRARNLKTGKVGWHCEHATTGCEFCYSEGFNLRLGTGLPFKPGHRKDIELFLDEEMLRAPLRWKKPRMIFVCSMTDAFADFVKDEWLDRMFAVMALCPQHTFQVLTKRAERMLSWFATENRAAFVGNAMHELVTIPNGFKCVPWPFPNVWLGVSAERQKEAEERIPHLLATRAAVRFISAEPLLGPIDLMEVIPNPIIYNPIHGMERLLDWVIVGGESGGNARPMHPNWARTLRDQCAATGVSFFFKQWGEWLPKTNNDGWNLGKDHVVFEGEEPKSYRGWPPGGGTNAPPEFLERVGKKAAGRLLDGMTHDGFPTLAKEKGLV